MAIHLHNRLLKKLTYRLAHRLTHCGSLQRQQGLFATLILPLILSRLPRPDLAEHRNDCGVIFLYFLFRGAVISRFSTLIRLLFVQRSAWFGCFDFDAGEPNVCVYCYVDSGDEEEEMKYCVNGHHTRPRHLFIVNGEEHVTWNTCRDQQSILKDTVHGLQLFKPRKC